MKEPDRLTESTHSIRLTQYSHGAGCGCKIAPALLEEILHTTLPQPEFPGLLVGNASKDDAAVFDLGNGTSVISTTDFFMPIVDDPFVFGQIAATNALSDIYAMGGKPLMAISIFGWPIDKLGPDIASKVIDGGRHACNQAGIPLAGGHSIDSPEPIFGLAVTGLVNNEFLKRNNRAEPGCKLFLTKPLGIGILTTAQKKNLLRNEHSRIASELMCQLNLSGSDFSRIDGVTAMTDVTGFGLLGHLTEMCEGSSLGAKIDYSAVPRLPHIEEYLSLGAVPGGTERNFVSYGHKISLLDSIKKQVLCDPQTSGGLLVAVRPDSEKEFLVVASSHGLKLNAIGELAEKNDRFLIEVTD
ncbi:MAG: selenide, water dikinase SelD [Gammaproteobacteria bacterium]|nr:selenide, water dikinase SelD [Gammaproteobacteria bacterium]